MEFKPLHSAEDLDSPYNHGQGFGIAVGSAAVLLWIIVPLVWVGLKLIGI